MLSNCDEMKIDKNKNFFLFFFFFTYVKNLIRNGAENLMGERYDYCRAVTPDWNITFSSNEQCSSATVKQKRSNVIVPVK